MNLKLVSRNLGIMLLLLAGAMGICVGLGYVLSSGFSDPDQSALGGWMTSLISTSIAGAVLLSAGWSATGKAMLRKDAIGMVGIGWIVCGLFAALPYIFCEPKVSFAAAVFESVSGLTTTGASIFTDLTLLPKTVILWRSVTQWLGGMGILAMFVLLSSSLGASGKSLFKTESSMHTNEIIGTTMKQTARWLWLLYIAITVMCAAGLWALDMNLFQALNHSMTTVSTGGFGTENTSINGFGVSTRIWLTFFMFLCGGSFPLYLALLRKRDWAILKSHEEAWVFTVMLLVFWGALVADRARAGGGFGDKWGPEAVDTIFNAVSIATTTGFVVGDYDTWPPIGKGLLLILMCIGGCAGSTAGGLKVSRVILWYKMLRTEIQRAFRPNLVVHHKLNGRTIPLGTRGQLFVIFTSAAACAALGSYTLAALEPDKSVDGCVSAVLSSISNVGPAFKEFGPTHNFASINGASMILLSILMVLGRLEYIALLVLLSRQLWRRY